MVLIKMVLRREIRLIEREREISSVRNRPQGISPDPCVLWVSPSACFSTFIRRWSLRLGHLGPKPVEERELGFLSGSQPLVGACCPAHSPSPSLPFPPHTLLLPLQNFRIPQSVIPLPNR